MCRFTHTSGARGESASCQTVPGQKETNPTRPRFPEAATWACGHVIYIYGRAGARTATYISCCAA